MAKTQKIKGLDFTKDMKDALLKFDLKFLLKWMKKYRIDLYDQMVKRDELVQMSTMCHLICNRTDMFNTEARKKAVRWLNAHNTRGGIF